MCYELVIIQFVEVGARFFFPFPLSLFALFSPYYLVCAIADFTRLLVLFLV